MKSSIRLLPWLALILLGAWAMPLQARTLEQARSALSAGDYPAAIEQAQALVSRDAAATEAWLVLAQARLASGLIDPARQAYRKAADSADRPRLDIDVARLRLELIYGDWIAARDRLRGLWDRYRAASRSLSVPELLAMAQVARILARDDPALYASALDILEQAIRQAPDRAAPHTAMGDLLLDRYNNREALEAYRDALAREPDYPPALLGLARSRHFDRSREALEVVQRCLEVQPNLVAARVLLARLHRETENYPVARDEIDAALAVNPRDPAALTLRSALAYLAGDSDGFSRHLKTLVDLAPGYTDSMLTLAEIAAQQRRYDDAVRFARGAIQIDAKAWRAYALGGINQLRLGYVEAAKRNLERAFRGDPFDPWTKNTLELIDRIQQHQAIASERFVLVAEPHEARVLAPYLLEIAEQAYDRYAARYGYRPRTPIRIEVYPRHEDFSVRTVGLVGVDILGVSFGPVVAFDSPSAGVFGPFNWASVLWHELAHTFHLGMTRGRVPRWFSEGLAVYEEHQARPGWGGDVSPGFLAAFREGRLVPISRLNQAFLRPSYPQQVIHAYYQGYLLMELIAREQGEAAIVAMLEGYRNGRTTAELIPDVLGWQPEALDSAFEAYLRDRYGHALQALFSGQGEGPYPVLLRAGAQALQAGELDRAETLLRSAQALFPEHAGPDSSYDLLARVYLGQGRDGKAAEQLQQSIARDADDLAAHRKLAELHLRRGQSEAAAGVLEKTLLIQPFDEAIQQQLAQAWEVLEQWPLAARAWSAVVALKPSDPAAARYHLAHALERAGDPRAARREVLAALEIAPLYDDALELLLRVRQANDEEDPKP